LHLSEKGKGEIDYITSLSCLLKNHVQAEQGTLDQGHW